MKAKEEEGTQAEDAGSPEAGRNVVLAYMDGDDAYGDLSDDEKYSAAAEELSKTKAFHRKMEDLFKSEPLIGALLGSVLTGGKSVHQALSELMSVEEFEEYSRQGGSEASEARAARLEQLRRREEQDKARESSVAERAKSLESYLASTGWEPARQEEFVDNVGDLFGIFSDGKVTENEWRMLSEMIYIDAIKTATREEGVLAGRREQLGDRLLKAEAAESDDGLPPITSGGGTAEEPPKKEGYFDAMLSSELERRKRMEQ